MKKKLIKSYYLSDLVEKSMTTKSDLEFIADKLGINLKVNWLKDVDPNFKGPQIINLGNPIISGTHWVATYNGKYFDSFGMIPPEKLDHLEWVPLQIQNQNYGRCGQYCILWLYYAINNELDQFYNLFETLN